MLKKKKYKIRMCFLVAVFLLSACSKGENKAQYQKGLEKLETETISATTAPDYSGSWDAYYDLWFLSGTEEAIEVPETKPMDGQMEQRIEFTEHTSIPVIDYISYSSRQKDLFLFSETIYQDAQSNNNHCQLKLVNSKNNTAETIYEFDSDGKRIHDPAITANHIYWIVASDTVGIDTGSWQLYGMDLEQREAILLREQEGQSMMPRLRNCGDRIVWLEPNEENTAYIVYQLSGMEEPEELFAIQNVSNPYVPIQYNDSILSYADYYDDTWHVLLYEMDTKELYSYPINHLEEWEYPTTVIASKHYITYATYFNRLYTYDRKTGETKQIGNTQYELEGNGDLVVWANGGNLILLDLRSGETTYLRKPDAENTETVLFVRHTEDQFYTLITNLEKGKQELTIYTPGKK